jgi:NAD(P)H dehydrogenase (quinone)
MSAEKFLVTGATGRTGRHTMQHLLEKGHAVRALVHQEDERSEALRSAGAEVVVGDLLEHDDTIGATAGTSAAYFCYPIRPGIIQATAYFADAAKRAGLKAVINMSQISAREDSNSHAARDHWIAERVFDWSGVPTVHVRPTFFSEWLILPWVRDVIVDEGVINLPFGEGRHAPIAAEDQARLIATILADPTVHIGRTYMLHGPTELSQQGIAEAIGGVLGSHHHLPSKHDRDLSRKPEKIWPDGVLDPASLHRRPRLSERYLRGRRQDNRRSQRPTADDCAGVRKFAPRCLQGDERCSLTPCRII